MKVVSNKDLFDRWQRLSNVMRFDHLSSIVQNDMDISDESFKEWKKIFHKEKQVFCEEANRVYRDTVKYINDLNRKEK